MSVERVEVPVEEGLSEGTPKADNTETNDLILGKFKSYEDLEKSYKELESKLGKEKAAEKILNEVEKPEPEDEWKAEGEEAEEPKEGDKPQTEADLQEFLPGFSEEKISEIYQYAWENGQLTDEHYSELEKAGYNRQVVDQFMQGQFAMAEAQNAQLLNAGGGQERVQAMFEWAEGNLSQEQIDAYNSKFDQGGADAIMAMEHLAAKFDADGGAAAHLVRGANAPTYDTADAFRSVAQVTEAIQDPRYHTDPAYRAEVERRLAKSNVL